MKSTIKVKQNQPEFDSPIHVEDRFMTRRMRISEAPTLVLSELSSSDSSPSPTSLRKSNISEPLLTIKYQKKIWIPENQITELPKAKMMMEMDKMAKSSTNDLQPKQEIEKFKHSKEQMMEFDGTRRREDDDNVPQPTPLAVNSNPCTSDDGSLRFSSYAPGRKINSKTNIVDDGKSQPLIAVGKSELSKILPSIEDLDDFDNRPNINTISSFETNISDIQKTKQQQLKSSQ
ncbi:hypothetical protein BLA29_008260, partial [Euroglyphus maynei]